MCSYIGQFGLQCSGELYFPGPASTYSICAIHTKYNNYNRLLYLLNADTYDSDYKEIDRHIKQLNIRDDMVAYFEYVLWCCPDARKILDMGKIK